MFTHVRKSPIGGDLGELDLSGGPRLHFRLLALD